jgi:hypothetical protein
MTRKPRKSTIGSNPLDAVVPAKRRGDAEADETTTVTADERPTKERFTVQLPVEVTERARNAVYWTPGATLADLVAEALAKHIDDLERERGEPFPERTGKVKTGRPMKR